jgi:hypothetical protein
MPQKRWLAVVTWTDGDVIDADEIAVFGDSIESAASAARAVWAAATSLQWPHSRIEDVQIFSLGRLSTLAE